jgi:hypothetical protein
MSRVHSETSGAATRRRHQRCASGRSSWRPRPDPRLPLPTRATYKPDLVVCDAADRIALAIELQVSPRRFLGCCARRGHQYSFFHWHLQFPQVFARGGFDVVLGNPPWVAHAGRAAQPLPPGVKLFFETNYESFANYPTTHGVFVGQMPTLLQLGGRLGFVIPSSVSELQGYEPTIRCTV